MATAAGEAAAAPPSARPSEIGAVNAALPREIPQEHRHDPHHRPTSIEMGLSGSVAGSQDIRSIAAPSGSAVARIISRLCIPESVRLTSMAHATNTIFSGGYFSITRVTSSEAREPAPLPANPAQLTDADKIARHDEWAPFGAAAGTYEMRGDTLVTRNFVAKAARNMTLTEQATVQQIDADTFTATAQTPGDPNVGRQTTYSRVR